MKAWESDQSFEWLQEYLYYSLVFGGRESEAYKIAGNFSTSMKKKIDYANIKITGVSVEAGYSFNPDFESLKATPHGQLAGVGEDYGEAFYLKNYHFESIDLSHRIIPAVSLNHNLTYLGINRGQVVDWGGSNIFSSGSNQFQYYMNTNLVLGRKWYISPAVNLIWGDISFAAGGFRGTQRYFNNSEASWSDFVFSVSTWSHFGNFSPGAEYNYATISNSGFSQYSMWLTVYPFANTNFYFTPRMYLKSGGENGFKYNTFGISGGLQAGPVHFYGQYLVGDMENFIEPAGYVVSNFPGISDQKFSGSLYFPTGKKYRFLVRYITQDVAETYQVYTNFLKGNSVEYKYQKHTLTAGISWSF